MPPSCNNVASNDGARQSMNVTTPGFWEITVCGSVIPTMMNSRIASLGSGRSGAVRLVTATFGQRQNCGRIFLEIIMVINGGYSIIVA